MTGEPSHVEIIAPDLGKTGEFFAQLFGWTFHPMGNVGEGWFETPTFRTSIRQDGAESRLDVYFRVPDLLAAIARVKELGGTADHPGEDEPGFGRFCSCRTSSGLRFGLHQS